MEILVVKFVIYATKQELLELLIEYIPIILVSNFLEYASIVYKQNLLKDKENKMTTKITLDPALVRTIYNLDKFSDVPKIQINNKWIGIEFIYLEKTPIRDISDFAREYATWFDIDLPQIYIDIHRLKDKAIEYLAGKGWDMIIYPNEIAVMLPMADPKSEGRPRMIFRVAEGFHPNKLSAGLAAISFVWEQIQKEKTNER